MKLNKNPGVITERNLGAFKFRKIGPSVLTQENILNLKINKCATHRLLHTFLDTTRGSGFTQKSDATGTYSPENFELDILEIAALRALQTKTRRTTEKKKSRRRTTEEKNRDAPPRKKLRRR